MHTHTMNSGSAHADVDWQADRASSTLAVSKLRDIHVGPNDILIIHVRTMDVPSSLVEKFLLKVKTNLHSVWERVGLAERVLYEAGESQGFSVIHVREPYPLKPASVMKKRVRSDPPIIG